MLSNEDNLPFLSVALCMELELYDKQQKTCQCHRSNSILYVLMGVSVLYGSIDF